MFSYLLKQVILKSFYSIDLSSIEREIVEESVRDKYAPALKRSLLSGILVIPAILFLDTNVLISVLIPITMVAGTAWFSISLANMKKKFESFGLELTTNMFEAFTSSLIFLGLLVLFSIIPLPTFNPSFWLLTASSILGILVIFNLLYRLFIGSLKYDINDAMLTGQNEAAERFFKKSLSLLHSASEELRRGKGLEVANYYLGLSFFEIFAFIRESGVLNGKLKGLMEQALMLKGNPAMEQAKADEISLNLIDKFVEYCKNIQGQKAEKSFENIKEELKALKKNKNEPQNMIDTRLSIIFEEIAELLELQGESLFRKKEE